MKILSPAEKALAFKDFGDIWDNKTSRSVLIVVPLVMVLLLPVVFLIFFLNVPMSRMNGVEQMLLLLHAQASGMDERQGMFYLMTNMICPMFFLMIPLMSSSVSAAYSFVGEKEHGTLETLLLTPLGVRKILKAKVLGCVLLSAVVTSVSFVLFSIVIAVGDLMLAMPFYFNWSWLVLAFLLSPAVIIFGVVFMVLASAKSKSYTESVQTSAYLVLPIVLLFTGQFTGLFQVGAELLLLISCVLLAVDFLIWFLTVRLFTPEKLLR
ncbi:ABC transporter permease subunit [Caproicibacter sp.]|uniref:ABC transporter permease subunit n=1 Tax=Caproicibacter sp. TaxID=2814884 RepID=UPI003989AA2C